MSCFDDKIKQLPIFVSLMLDKYFVCLFFFFFAATSTGLKDTESQKSDVSFLFEYIFTLACHL